MKLEFIGKFEKFIILLLIIAGAFGVRLYKIGNPIADWHSWRQADTASVSYLYVKDGINLLYPRYFDVSAIQTGYTNLQGLRFVEFPIFNVVHALLFKNIGRLSFDEWGRMVSVISSVITVFLLFILGQKISGKWVGLLSAFFYAFLPFNVYFTRVILPEPMAVMFCVFGVLVFYKFYETDKKRYLFLSALLFAIALLLKPFAVFYGVAPIYLLFKKYNLKNILQNISLYLALDIVLIPLLLWRAWLNTGANLVGIPFYSWLFNGDGIRFRPAFFRWIFSERLGSLILGVWGLPIFFVGLLFSTKKNKMIASLLFGMLLYVVTVATANVRHDYYQTFIIPVVCLTLAYGFVELLNNKFFPAVTTLFLLLFSVGMMFMVGWQNIRDNYQINHFEIVTAGEEVIKLTPEDARIIAPYNGDTAFLYQTKRFGWPIVDRSIEELIALGAKYYVSVNFDTDTNNFMKSYKTIKKTDKYIILDLTQKI